MYWNRGIFADRSRTKARYAHYDAPPTTGTERLTVSDYLDHCAEANAGRYADGKSRYLQQCLAARPRAGAAVEPDARVPPRLRVAPDAVLLKAFGESAGYGDHVKTKLYIGHRGALSRCHCDGYDGLVCQLDGEKRVVLFDPLQARHLCVFPQRHALETRPRVHVDAPDVLKFPRYADAAGCSTVLRPGDCLYLPHHWWHHIECCSDVTVSANLWMSTRPRGNQTMHWARSVWSGRVPE